MSKYNSYAKKLNETAKALFDDYTKAAQAYESAKKSHDGHPYSRGSAGLIPAEQAASLARAKADMLEAKAQYEAAKNALVNGKETMRSIQREFVDALEADICINPLDLDLATVEILKSGILRSHEYAKLISANKDNPTMSRVIGQYAKQALKSAKERADMLNLTDAIKASEQADGGAYREAFDSFCAVYDKCARTPAMIPHWDELTSAAVENF